MEKLYIVKVLSGFDGAGTLNSELAFINELRRQGEEVTGCIMGRGPSVEKYLEALDGNGTVFDFQRPMQEWRVVRELCKPVLNAARDAQAAKKALLHIDNKKNKTRVVVRQPFLVPVAGLLGKYLEAPVFWHLNSVLSEKKKRRFRRYCRKYDLRPIANSVYTQRNAGLSSWAGVVYPGFWPERVEPDPDLSMRSALGISEDAAVFGSMARIHPSKAPDLVLKAFIESEPFLYGAHLIIAGGPLEGELGADLIETARGRGQGRVHVLGPQDSVREFYSTIDVAINGRRNAEAFGISVVEALGARKPVIALALGGPTETIEDGETGWLIEQPTEESYRHVFNEAWRKRDQWRQMGEKAERSSRKYRVSAQVGCIRSIMQAIS